MGLTKRDLRKIMKKRGMGNREIAKLFRGKFTPVNYSKSLMEKRWKQAKEVYKKDNPIKSYFYPRSELNSVIRKYRNKSLKYAEELEDRSSIIVPDERVKTTSMMPDLDFSMPAETRVQAPPLPSTPQPRQMEGLASLQVSPATGLTRTETALLSPGEQAIRQSQRGTA